MEETRGAAHVGEVRLGDRTPLRPPRAVRAHRPAAAAAPGAAAPPAPAPARGPHPLHKRVLVQCFPPAARSPTTLNTNRSPVSAESVLRQF